MENILRIAQQDSAVEDQIYEDRLKFFTSKVKIWDYFSISQQRWLSLSLEERTSMFKKFYHNLDAKLQVSVKIYLLFVSLFLDFLLLLLDVVVDIAIKEAFDYLCLENAPTAIDSSVSAVVKKVNVVSFTKIFLENGKNIETKVVALKFNGEIGALTSGQLFYSFYKPRIPKSFGGTMFVHHRLMFESD